MARSNKLFDSDIPIIICMKKLCALLSKRFNICFHYKMMCFAPGCFHYNDKHKCKFFTFPKDKTILKKWIKYIRRADRLPSKHSRICSCHFKDGKRESYPLIYNRNKTKFFNFVTPQTGYKKEDKNAATRTQQNLQSLSSGPSTEADIIIMAENTLLQSENNKLKKEIHSLKTVPWCFKVIEGKDGLIRFYTGLPSQEIMNAFLNLFEDIEVNYYCGWKVTRISQIDQIFMTLIKLRLNLTHTDMSVRFACSRQTVTNVTITWIHIFHKYLCEGLMNHIPSQLKNKTCLPNCFSKFTNCRMVIDCTEVYCAISRKSFENQKLTYSHYKHRNTFKALVGVAPNGVITYTSELYPGSTSDKAIVSHSQLLSNFSAGDLILADKGFLISDILPPGVSLNIPPFLTTPQFTPNQVFKTTSIARARIHVERAIQRVKGYSILDHIPYYLHTLSTKIWQVTCALTNLQYPLIKEVEIFYNAIDEDQ